MIFKKSHFAVAAAALIAMAAPFASIAQDIKPRLIRFGYGLNEDSNQGRAVKYFAEEVAKLSGNKMKVRAIGAAALGSDIQQQQALVGGAQELMVGSTTTLAGTVKEMGLWDTPFLFNTTQEADTILDGPVGQKVLNKLPEKGLVGLVYWENGFRNTTNSKKPIATLEDFQGLKLRVMQNPVFLDTFKALGTNPVPMAYSELFGALETKTVDGQENPYTNIASSKFYEVQKYVTATNHAYTPFIVLASKKFWDGLSKDEQKVLTDAAKSSRAFERKDTRESSEKALADLRAKGMQFSKMDDKEVKRLRDKLTQVNASIGATVGMDLWNETQAELAKLRK